MHLVDVIEALSLQQRGELVLSWAKRGSHDDPYRSALAAAQAVVDVDTSDRPAVLRAVKALDEELVKADLPAVWSDAWLAANWVRVCFYRNTPVGGADRVLAVGGAAGVAAADMWDDALTAAGYDVDPAGAEIACGLAGDWDGDLAGLVVAATALRRCSQPT